MTKNRTTWLACALAILAAFGLALADDGGRPITVAMTGAEEPNGGDPDGSGEAVFTFNPGTAEVCFQLTVRDIAPATAAHIHRAPAGVNGRDRDRPHARPPAGRRAAASLRIAT